MFCTSLRRRQELSPLIPLLSSSTSPKLRGTPPLLLFPYSPTPIPPLPPPLHRGFSNISYATNNKNKTKEKMDRNKTLNARSRSPAI